MLAGHVEVMLGGGIQGRGGAVLGGRGRVILQPRAAAGLGRRALRGLGCSRGCLAGLRGGLGRRRWLGPLLLLPVEACGAGAFPAPVLGGFRWTWGAGGGQPGRPAVTVSCAACAVGGAGATTQGRGLSRQGETDVGVTVCAPP